jgi:hypothetical protein
MILELDPGFVAQYYTSSGSGGTLAVVSGPSSAMVDYAGKNSCI